MKGQEGYQVLLPVLDHSEQQAEADNEEDSDEQEAGEQVSQPEVWHLGEPAGDFTAGHLHHMLNEQQDAHDYMVDGQGYGGNSDIETTCKMLMTVTMQGDKVCEH